MNEVFDAVDRFVQAVRRKAGDAAAKAGDVFEELADWCRSQAGESSPQAAAQQPPRFVDNTRLAAVRVELEQCRQSLSGRPGTQAMPIAAGAGFDGSRLLKILSLVEAVLSAFGGVGAAQQPPVPVPHSEK